MILTLIVFGIISGAFIGWAVTTVVLFDNCRGNIVYVDENKSFYVELYDDEDIEKMKDQKYVIFNLRRKNNY